MTTPNKEEPAAATKDWKKEAEQLKAVLGEWYEELRDSSLRRIYNNPHPRATVNILKSHHTHILSLEERVKELELLLKKDK